MQTAVTSKYQITIPKRIRELLGIEKNDKVVWEVSNKSVNIRPVKKTLKDFVGFFDIEEGDIVKDIDETQKLMAEHVLCKHS